MEKRKGEITRKDRRDRKVVTRGWLDQTRGGKTTPRIIAFLSPRKEDRVIYNDTFALSNERAAIGSVMYIGIRFNGIRSASIAIYNAVA